MRNESVDFDKEIINYKSKSSLKKRYISVTNPDYIRRLEIFKKFFNDRPSLNIHSFCNEAGISNKMFNMIKTDERSLTNDMFKKCLPIMKKYGFIKDNTIIEDIEVYD